MTSERITRSEIDEVKRRHILQNLLYSPVEAAQILAISVRSVFRLVEEGELDPAGRCLGNGNNTKGTRITAESVEKHRKKITVRGK